MIFFSAPRNKDDGGNVRVNSPQEKEQNKQNDSEFDLLFMRKREKTKKEL